MSHIHKDIDFVVEAYIVYKDKVLLVNHITAKMWLPVGGHIELDEDPEEALFREIKEESGIDKKDLKIFAEKPDLDFPGFDFLYRPTFLDIHDINSGHRHTAFVYFFKSEIGKVSLKNDEHLDIRWFSKSDLKNKKFNISSKVNFFAQEAFRITS